MATRLWCVVLVVELLHQAAMGVGTHGTHLNQSGLYAATTSYQSKCNADGTCTYTFSLTVPGTQIAKAPDGLHLGSGGLLNAANGEMKEKINELTQAVKQLNKGPMHADVEGLKKELKRARKLARRMNKNSHEMMNNMLNVESLKAGRGQARNQSNSIINFQSDANTLKLKEKLRKMERKMKNLERLAADTQRKQDQDYQAARKAQSVVVRVNEPSIQKTGMDCAALYQNGVNISGIYKVQPDPERKETQFYVFCDMENDGGGWTVIQRREDGTENFNQSWAQYKKGFGDLEFEYWLGLEKAFILNQFGNKQIRFDIWDFRDKQYYAQYNKFKLSDEASGYKIMVGGYTGTAGDAFHYANKYLQHHNMKFSTYDKDNDKSTRNCAKTYSGGWWYKDCMVANLNGIYYNVGQGHTRFASRDGIHDGIMWQPLDNYKSFARTEIRIRPPHFIHK